METNEIMTNDEVVEVDETEETTKKSSGLGFKIVAGLGAAAIVGGLAYQYAAKPIIAKIKAKKNKKLVEADAQEIDDADEEETIETIVE